MSLSVTSPLDMAPITPMNSLPSPKVGPASEPTGSRD